MLKLLERKSKMEKELNGNVKIFGENISVKIIYSKIKNPELELVGKNINVFLPNKYKKDVLRYVILYEFCRLKYKSRAKGFYQMLEKYMPDYEQYSYFFNVA